MEKDSRPCQGQAILHLNWNNRYSEADFERDEIKHDTKNELRDPHGSIQMDIIISIQILQQLKLHETNSEASKYVRVLDLRFMMTNIKLRTSYL